jgi:sulfur transfer complex TusBCD TusB component (DsrH family)
MANSKAPERKHVAGKFRNKPLIVLAMNASDVLLTASIAWEELPEWLRYCYENGDIVLESDGVSISTNEGVVFANLDDWIVRGVNGEVHACKPDIFEKTYEKVED